jgi:hypothetical protein
VSSIIYSIMRAFLAILATVGGGLHGFVQKGPIVPVCRSGEPCTAPVQVTLLFRRAGRVYRTRSDAGGRYRITLPRGY